MGGNMRMLAALILFLVGAAVFAQGQGGAGKRGKNHKPPCWQQAGITREAMEHRKSIEQKAKADVAAVCADSSLSTKQKHERIREIHQQTKQEIGGFITPQQEEALKSCHAARHEGHGAGRGGGRAGPCGEAETASSPTPKP